VINCMAIHVSGHKSAWTEMLVALRVHGSCVSQVLAYENALSQNPIMEKNFSVCPHCAAKGKRRWIQPATPQRTPLVSRSDGGSFHLFLEESHASAVRDGSGFQISALYRYDLDSLGIKGESTLVSIRVPAAESNAVGVQYEEAADRLASLLAKGESLLRHYVFPPSEPSDPGPAIDLMCGDVLRPR